MTYYVKIKHQPVFYPPACVCVLSGQTRDSERGTEAQFFCIDPNCPESEIWATRGQLVINTPPTQESD